MVPPIDIFISYSSADRPVAEKLSDLLSKAYNGVWLDRKLVGGEKWWPEILQKIAECNQFLYLISRDSLESEWCEKEFLEAQQLGKSVIPVLVRSHTQIPEDLRQRQIVDMSKGITVENLNQLYAALIKASKARSAEEIDEKRLLADLELLQQLWPLISVQKMVRLDDDTQSHYIDRTFYRETVRTYLHLRDNPQNTFFNPTLEASFKSFDEAMWAYHEQCALAFSAEVIDDDMVFMSNYKMCSRAHYGVTQEIIELKLREYNKTVDYVLAVRDRHNKLVNTIRSLYLDFDFSDDEV